VIKEGFGEKPTDSDVVEANYRRRELTFDLKILAQPYSYFVSAVALCGAFGISGCFSRTNNQVCVVSGPK
jgi:hypothetical protein